MKEIWSKWIGKRAFILARTPSSARKTLFPKSAYNNKNRCHMPVGIQWFSFAFITWISPTWALEHCLVCRAEFEKNEQISYDAYKKRRAAT